MVTLEGVKSAEGFQERAAKISRTLAKYRPAVEKIGDPDLLTALDADLALTTTWEKTTDAVQMLTELGKKGPQSKLCAVVESKYGVPPTATWSGYVGFSDSAPASDGERVYAVFGQGQIVCYDLEGRLVWAHRSVMTKGQARNAMGAGFSRVPLLVGDRLIVRDEGYQKRSLCFDARTGKILWTYPWGKTGGMLIGHSHLRLNGPDGAPVDVIIMSEEHKIVRLSDGKELGEFRAEKKAPAYNILAWDDTDTIVVGGKSTSGPLEPSACYRIKMTGPDSATGELVYELEKKCMMPMSLFTATYTHIFAQGGGIYDRKTGAKVGQLPDEPTGWSAVIAGHYLIKQGVTTDAYGRKRQDNMATCTWHIFDISDPAKPRKVNQGLNLLGYKDPPADYIVTKYLADRSSLSVVTRVRRPGSVLIWPAWCHTETNCSSSPAPSCTA